MSLAVSPNKRVFHLREDVVNLGASLGSAAQSDTADISHRLEDLKHLNQGEAPLSFQ